MFSLVLFGGTRLATPAASDARWPVSRSLVGRGSVRRVPLCCGPLDVKRQPPQRSTSSWAPLDPPSFSQEKKKKKKKQLLQDRPITALCHTWHLQWGGVEG